MVVLLSGIFWLYFCALERSQDVPSILIYVNGKRLSYKLITQCFFLTQRFPCATANVFMHQHLELMWVKMKNNFSYRLHVVLSYRERWTDWHQIPAHMMISSQSLYPTVTRMEISMQNRSVILCTHSLSHHLFTEQITIWQCVCMNYKISIIKPKKKF